jgi:hypothetical protein
MGVVADIASLRTRYQSIAELVYSDRCSVSRVTQVDDGRGHWVDTWSLIATDIPVGFVPYDTAKEIVIAGQLKGFADGDAYLPAIFDGGALDVNEADRLIIAANGAEPERALEIIFPAPHQGVLIQAVVRQINGPYVTNRQIEFSFDTESPLSLGTITAGKVLRSITVQIQEAFDDPTATLAVGVDGDPDSLMDESTIIPSLIELFRVQIDAPFGSDTEVFLTITQGVSTQGSGYVELEFDA